MHLFYTNILGVLLMVIFLVLFLLISNVSFAKVYHWVDEQGFSHYSTTPPPKQQTKEYEMKQPDTKGLGGNVGTTTTAPNINQKAPKIEDQEHVLSYGEKLEIEKLEDRLMRSNITSSLKKFYNKEIQRIQDGDLNELTSAQKSYREKQMKYLAREFLDDDEIKYSIKSIENLYK